MERTTSGNTVQPAHGVKIEQHPPSALGVRCEN